MSRKGLGKGLDVLIPEFYDEILIVIHLSL